MIYRSTTILSIVAVLALVGVSALTIAIRNSRATSVPREFRVIFVKSSQVGTPQSGVWSSSAYGLQQVGLTDVSAGSIESIFALPDNGGLAYIVGENLVLSSDGERKRWSLPNPTDGGEWLICGYDRLARMLVLNSNRQLLRVSIEHGTLAPIDTAFLSRDSISTADGRLIAGIDVSDCLVLVSTKTGAVIRRFRDLPSGSPAISPDGKRLAVFGTSGRTAIYDTTGPVPQLVTEIPRPVRGSFKRFVWTPDGKYLVFEVSKVVNPWLGGEYSDSVLSAIRVSDGSRTILPYVVKQWCWGTASM